MRLPLPTLAAVALCSAGCGHCGSSTGWRFEVLSPPVIMSPSLVASGPAPIGTVGFGTVEHRAGQTVQLVQDAACVSQTPIRPMQAAAPDCTLQEACDRIRALELQLRRSAKPEMAPMPNRVEEPKKPTEE